MSGPAPTLGRLGPPTAAAWIGWRSAIGSLGPLDHDPAELRRRAQELLSRPPYADEDEGLSSRLLGWLGDRVADLLDGALGQVFGLPVVPWLIALVGVIALGFVVWRVTRGLVVDRSIAEVPAEATTRHAEDWHRDADAHAARGELLLALRCRYSALVVALVDRGIIEDVPGRTVRELDAEVATTDPEQADAVEAAGERFERAVYGSVPVTDDDLAVVTTAARAASRARRTGVVGGGRP